MKRKAEEEEKNQYVKLSAKEWREYKDSKKGKFWQNFVLAAVQRAKKDRDHVSKTLNLLFKLQDRGNFRELIYSLSFFAEALLNTKGLEAKQFFSEGEVNGNSLPWKEAVVLLKQRGVALEE